MHSSNNLDNHQAWGGQGFQYEESATIHQESRPRPLSQVGFIASDSDELFHPTPGRRPSRLYSLPPIPPRRTTYTQPSTTSYNNPTFAIPPRTPVPVLTRYNSRPLGPPPPIPPRIRSLSPSPNISAHLQHNSHPIPTSSAEPSLPLPTCHGGCHSSSSPNVLKTLPTVSHIPVLTAKTDFFAWDEGVTTLLRANGLLGHILDPSDPIDLSRPDRMASPAPILSHRPLAEEISAFNLWWDRDNVAQHVLMSRLGQLPRGLLPPPNITTRTALSIYKTMTKYYGTCSFADCTELLNSLHNSTCTPGRVSDYVTKWRTGLSRLQSARFVFNVKICISLFVRGLPLISAFTILCATLPERLAGIGEADLGSFITLTETVLDLDTIFRSASQSQGSRPGRLPPSTATSQPLSAPLSSVHLSATTLSSASTDAGSRSAKSPLLCGNCKSRGLRCTGHTDATCFQPGGGMEGRREEYLSNKGRFHAMFVECLDNASLSLDVSILPDPPPSALSPSLPPTLDDDVILAPLANLCVPTFPPNTDFDFDLYHLRDRSPLLSHFAFSSVDFSTSALASMVSLYNALLDSGCTHHIVRDPCALYHLCFFACFGWYCELWFS